MLHEYILPLLFIRIYLSYRCLVSIEIEYHITYDNNDNMDKKREVFLDIFSLGIFVLL